MNDDRKQCPDLVEKRSDLQELSDQIDSLRATLGAFREDLQKMHGKMFTADSDESSCTPRQEYGNKIGDLTNKVQDCQDIQSGIRTLMNNFDNLLA